VVLRLRSHIARSIGDVYFVNLQLDGAGRYSLAAALGGFGKVAVYFTPIYLVGILAVLWLPETRGKGLPD
jgi:hypothetical protein